MFKAYFDASKRPSGIFCVAGFAFTEPQVKKFDQEWWDIFGKYGGCHMRELAHGAGRFKGVNSSAAGKLQKRAVRVIKRRMSYGVAVSCDLNEINDLLPAWIEGFQDAFPVCCHAAMAGMGVKLDKMGVRDEVAYFFESGDEFSGVAHDFMSRTDDTPELKASYHHGSHTFIPNEKARPLQAADMLAWEWTKFIDETFTQRKREARKSLKALMNYGEDERYQTLHLTGAPLKKFMDQVSRLGLMQIVENAMSASSARSKRAAKPS